MGIDVQSPRFPTTRKNRGIATPVCGLVRNDISFLHDCAPVRNDTSIGHTSAVAPVRNALSFYVFCCYASVVRMDWISSVVSLIEQISASLFLITTAPQSLIAIL